jgi:hypothetical protein
VNISGIVAVGVAVTVGVAVAVGVEVSVALSVGVAVEVGGRFTVEEGVALAVGSIGVAVAVGCCSRVEVGLGAERLPSSPPLHAARSRKDISRSRNEP